MSDKKFLWADSIAAIVILACWGLLGYQSYVAGNWGEDSQADLTATRIKSMYFDLEAYQDKKERELQDLRYQFRGR